MRRVGLAVAIVVALILGSSSPGFACSRMRIETPEEILNRSSGAFVGILISQSDVDRNGFYGLQEIKYTFLVEWAVKGPMTRRLDVYGVKNDCGAGIPRGKRIGLVVNRDKYGWGADSADVQDADKLIAAAPTGTVVKLGSLGLAQRLWLRAQTFPAKVPLAIVGAFLVVFIITFRADRRRIRALRTSEQPAP